MFYRSFVNIPYIKIYLINKNLHLIYGEMNIT